MVSETPREQHTLIGSGRWFHLVIWLEQTTQWSIISRCVCVCAQSLNHVWLWNPMDCSLPDSSLHGDSPGKNTGVGCHALLQGIFPTEGSNPGLLLLLHCRQTLYCWTAESLGNPYYIILYIISYHIISCQHIILYKISDMSVYTRLLFNFPWIWNIVP